MELVGSTNGRLIGELDDGVGGESVKAEEGSRRQRQRRRKEETAREGRNGSEGTEGGRSRMESAREKVKLEGRHIGKGRVDGQVVFHCDL